MAENLGSAMLELRVDLQKFENELKQALMMVKNTLTEMKQGLNINVDNVNFKPVEQGLKGVENAGKGASSEIKEMGNAGSDTLEKFGKFELIQGIFEAIKQAGSEIKGYFMDLAHEFAGAEVMTEKLRGGLERMGQSNMFEPLIKQSEELAKITPYSHEEIQDAQAMLTTFNLSGEAIEKLIPSMLNLGSAYADASGKGMDLRQVSMMIGKAAGADLVTAMQRVGVVMTDLQVKQLETATGMERVNIFLDIMKTNSNITAEALGKTLAGQLIITKNLFDDFKEELGAQLKPVIEDILKAIQNFSEWLISLPAPAKDVVIAIGAIGIAVAATIPIFMTFDVVTGGIIIAVGAVVAGIAALGVALFSNMDAVKNWVTEMVGGEANMNALKDAVDAFWQGLQELWDVISNAVVGAFNELKAAAIDVATEIFGLNSGSGNLLTGLKDLITNGFNALKLIITAVIDTTKNIIIEFLKLISHNSTLKEGVNDTTNGFGNFKTMIQQAANSIANLVKDIGNVIKAILSLCSALEGIAELSLLDTIFNPGKWSANIDKIKNAGTEFYNSLNDKGRYVSNTPMGPDNPYKKEEKAGEDGNMPENKTEQKPPGTGSKGSDKSGSTEKIASDEELEKQRLEEIIKLSREEMGILTQKLGLGDVTRQQLDDYITAFKAQLEGEYTSVQYGDNKKIVEKEILSLREKLKESTDALLDKEKKANEEIANVDKFIEKRQDKVLTGVNKEVNDIEDAYKKTEEKILKLLESRILSEIQADEQLRKLKKSKDKEVADKKKEYELQLDGELANAKLLKSGNQLAIDIKAINDEYNLEIKRITDKYGVNKKTEELIKLEEEKRMDELFMARMKQFGGLFNAFKQGFDAVANAISTGMNAMWDSVFGTATNLFDEFMKTVTLALAKLAANEFLKMIIKAVTGGSGGVFGALMSLFGTGGYTGDGQSDEVAGIVHKNEYVVSERGVNALGLPLLDKINQGFNIANYVPRIEPFNYDYRIDYGSLPVMNPVSQLSSNNSTNVINNNNINVSGIRNDTNDWVKIVDEHLIPKIADGLKRIGKNVLDSSISIS